MKKMNRRDFLKTAAVGAAGMGAMGILGASASEIHAAGTEAPEKTPDFDGYDLLSESRVVWKDIPEEEIGETKDYDLVVIGAGTAGTTAAMIAAEKGAGKVAVLQNASVSISQGNMGSGLVINQSTEYGLKRFIHEWNKNNLWRSDYHMVENYTKYSGYAADYVLSLAQEAGFEHILVMDDVIDFGDGQQVTSKRVLFQPKPITYGDAMQAISTLGPSKGVDFYFSCPGVKLIQDGEGRVIAAIGLDENTGKYIRFNAAKAVILACGSFVNNQAMLARYCTDALGYTAKVAGRYGDGHLMGLLAGGVMRNGAHSKMVHDNDAGPMQDVPFLAVDYNGERFINEEVDSTLWNNIAKDSLVKGRFFHIFDGNYMEFASGLGGRVTDEAGMLAYMPGTEEALAKGVYANFVATYRADSLKELAEILGIPTENLIKTVERYNELCEQGMDTDFGKEAKYLAPIKNPPFWGVNRWCRLSTILSGLNVNKYQQVLNAENEPIPGLYAAGNCSGTPGGSCDWTQVSLGESLGFAFTEGYVAGCHVAGALE